MPKNKISTKQNYTNGIKKKEKSKITQMTQLC